MNVQAIDLGDEIRHGVQSRLDLAPVVFRGPIARELLDRRELHALGRIGDRFLFGESCRDDALAQVGKFRIGKVHAERTNGSACTAGLLNNCTHGFAPV